MQTQTTIRTSKKDAPKRLSLFDNNTVFNSNAANSGPRPLRLNGGFGRAPNSPISPGLSSAPPAFARKDSTSANQPVNGTHRKPVHSRRQSSISYISSGDRDREWKLRSIPPLERRKSLALASSREESESEEGKEENTSVTESQPNHPPRPLTLAEKYATSIFFSLL